MKPNRRREKAARHSKEGVMSKKLIAAGKHRRAGRLKDALSLYREVLEEDTGNLTAHISLAQMSLDMGQVESAASMALRALSISSQDPRCQKILDQVIARMEGEDSQAQVLFEYSQILKEEKKWKEALIPYRRALRLNPSLAASDTFDSITLLSGGDLENGWWAYEWRNTVGSLGPFTDRVWNEEDLTGKTVLVWGEQGIGDQIMFSTCFPDIIEQAGQAIIGVDERLTSLFSRSFPKASIHGVSRYSGGETQVSDFDWLQNYPPVDFFVLAGSLPRFFRPTIDSFPKTSNRLIPEPDRLTHWRKRLDKMGSGKKVGICWRSIRKNEELDGIYPLLELWEPLLASPGFQFVNLQPGITPQEVDSLKSKFGIELMEFQELDLVENLDDTSALISALDGVVTTLVYTQWLAAAVGTPVWSIARGNRKNQWGFLGEDAYPWFPEMNVCLEEENDLLHRAFGRAAREISES